MFSPRRSARSTSPSIKLPISIWLLITLSASRFNAKYITDVIRNITDEKLCMRFNSNVSPCVIAPQEGEDYLYLILPVRVFT